MSIKMYAVALVAVIGFSAVVRADDVKAPSAAAICGYKWREAKKADNTLKGREAWSKFRSESCGSAVKTRNDDAIRQYLEQHKTEMDDDYEERVQIARRGK